MNINDEIDKRMAAEAGAAKPCILCGRPTFSRGIFTLQDLQLGEDFFVISPFCEKEKLTASNRELVESIFDRNAENKLNELRSRGAEME